VLGAVLQAVRQGLDLDADPAASTPCWPAARPATRRHAPARAGMDGFELAVRVILGQQVTVKAARTLVQRLVQRFGTPIDTPFARR
jgi:AraC family transcriptional regulator of adaptative response / DNA-3-methyladenine glycosylase II